MDKEHILAEIRRTALENGGRPLGSMRFFTETGIKDSDWRGKLWARWSDALEEAGLAPNAFQEAYDEDALLARLVQLTRELRRVPSVTEMRLRSHTDTTFPASTTFLRRYGGKVGLLARLRSYVIDHSEHHDVLPLIQQLPAPTAGALTESREDKCGVEIGSVYLLKSGRYWKIGRSNAAGRRERELALQLPQRAKIVHEIRTDDPAGIEAYWHKRFAERRLNGEWFDLNAADVVAFTRRKFM